MPVNDWTRVFDGAFHHFHLSWISELSHALNGGLLSEIHAEFLRSYYEETPGVSEDEPLTLVADRTDLAPTAYFEPVGFDRPLPDMPLFLTPQHYINVPLE